MKINSCTDIFYQDPCGNATFHLQCSAQGSQGHKIESGMQELGRGSSPYSALAANRKMNEVGTEIERGSLGMQQLLYVGGEPPLQLASLFKCEIARRFKILSILLLDRGKPKMVSTIVLGSRIGTISEQEMKMRSGAWTVHGMEGKRDQAVCRHKGQEKE